MIQLLFTILLAEAAALAMLLFHTPLREVALLGLDRLKRGRGVLVVRTVAAAGFVLLSSSLYSIAKIRSQSPPEAGRALGPTPTDQVLLSRLLLEASLIGYSLFLAIVIGRFHHCIREWPGVRRSLEAVKKQNRVLVETNTRSLKERDEVIAGLNVQIRQMKLASEENMKQAKKAELNATALTKQAEGLLLEYDRLLEENQSMRSQLKSIDRRLSHSQSKKDA